jgi:transcriptional regulator with XRE-family HTH domain
MRNEMQAILKAEMRIVAINEREHDDITQEQMAELLFMNPRSYSDIECGVTACGALTTVLLLMRMQDPEEFLQDLRLKFDGLLGEGSV